MTNPPDIYPIRILIGWHANRPIRRYYTHKSTGTVPISVHALKAFGQMRSQADIIWGEPPQDQPSTGSGDNQ